MGNKLECALGKHEFKRKKFKQPLVLTAEYPAEMETKRYPVCQICGLCGNDDHEIIYTPDYIVLEHREPKRGFKTVFTYDNKGNLASVTHFKDNTITEKQIISKQRLKEHYWIDSIGEITKTIYDFKGKIPA